MKRKARVPTLWLKGATGVKSSSPLCPFGGRFPASSTNITWSKDSGWPSSKLICSLALTRVPGSSSCALMKLRTQPNSRTQLAMKRKANHMLGSLMTWGTELGYNSLCYCEMAFSTALYPYHTTVGAFSYILENNVQLPWVRFCF